MATGSRSSSRALSHSSGLDKDLLPLDQRSEVMKSFFETLGIHALDEKRVSDLSQHAARQSVVERRRQPCSITDRGAPPATPSRQHASNLKKLELVGLVLENGLGDCMEIPADFTLKLTLPPSS